MTQIQVLRFRHLPEILGISEATIRRLLGRNEFPAPVRLSPNAIGWRREVIESWLESRKAATH